MDSVRQLLVSLFLLASAAPVPAGAQTFYVATNGAGRGPLLSFSAALQQARELHRQGPAHVRLLLHGGIYPLNQPLVLTAEDSGLVIAAVGGEHPVLSGQTEIRGWTVSPLDASVWQAEIADARDGHWIFHELFVNGQRRIRTRVPAQGYFHMIGASVEQHPTQLRIHPRDIPPDWARPGDVELIEYSAWAQVRNQIREINAASNLVSLAGNALPNTAEPNARFYIENAPVPLQPGQWHLDPHAGLLTYRPEVGEDVARATITAPRLDNLVQIKGQAGHPAHDIVFQGITFADADWRFDGGNDVDIQAAVETPGAVRAEFARACAFERCAFERLGGYALELGSGCQEDKITGNDLRDLGAGGIRVGDSDMNKALANPCGGHTIADNHIHNFGLVNAPGVGIFVLLSGHNQIAHNEVDHSFYTAISVGWTWGYGPTPCRDNVIEFNHLHDIGQGRLSDLGGVYTLGLQPGTIVRNNLIHDVSKFAYGGWGLYTDEGSTGIVLENNLVYRCQTAGFHQHYGRDNVIRHNIFACNTECQLMRTRIQAEQSFIFTNNIIYFEDGALFGGNWGDDLEMDHNLYYDTRSVAGDYRTRDTFRAWQKRGHDLHSQFVDPLFVDPRRNDFRLQPKSPARPFGFGPIDLTGVGVRPKSLQP